MKTAKWWKFAATGAAATVVLAVSGQTGAAAATPSVVISELSETNWSGLTDSLGSHDDWIELHNTSATAVDLSGYGLSGRDDSPLQWRLPAGSSLAANGYLVVELSGNGGVFGGELHANFSVDNGDAVQLAGPDGKVLDATNPKKMNRDTSWCRTGGSGDFGYCATPTPGAANSGPSYPSVLDAPELSVASGLYDTAVTVAVTAQDGATVRYTTDGSEPTSRSTLYATPLRLTGNTVLRASAFLTGNMQSSPATASYVIGAGTLTRYAGKRVIMVAMSPADAAAHAQGSKNAKFASSVAMIGPNGKPLFDETAETDVPGQTGSLISPQKGLDVSFRDALGASSVKGQLIPGVPVTSYKRFRLRNGGNDWWSTRLRDVHAAAVAADGPNLSSGYVPADVFINGSYYGMLELRQKEDETLVESALGVDRDTVDFLTDPLLGSQEVNNGITALSTYQNMYDWVTTHDQSVPANYARSTQLLDPVSLSADWALHMWAANQDWPGKNTHIWRSTASDGRWHWQPHDFDTAEGFVDFGGPINNQIVRLDFSYNFGLNGSQLIKALLKSPTFKATYLNAMADLLSTSAAPKTAAATLDAEAAAMRPFIAQSHARWFLTPDAAAWTRSVAAQRTWLLERAAYADAHTQKYFGVSARKSLTVALAPAEGTVKVNSVDVATHLAAGASSWTGAYYPQAPVQLTAVPKPGYVFAGWAGASTSTDRTITLPVVTATSVTARFAPAKTAQAPKVTAIVDQRGVVGDVIRLQVAAADPDGLPLTYSAKGLPAGLKISPADGVIYGRLENPDVDPVSVTVDDGAGKTKVSFNWTAVNS